MPEATPIPTDATVGMPIPSDAQIGDQNQPSLVDRLATKGQHMLTGALTLRGLGDAVGSSWPGRLATAGYHMATGDPAYKSEFSSMIPDAARDFTSAMAGFEPAMAPEAAATGAAEETAGTPAVLRGKGKFGTPVSDWGKRIPPPEPPVYPGAPEPATPPHELTQARSLASGPTLVPPAPSAGLGAIPARPGTMMPPAGYTPPEVPAPGERIAPPLHFNVMPEDPGQVGKGSMRPVPSRADELDTKGIQEELRERGEAEDRLRLKLGRDRFVNNPKGARIDEANAARGRTTVVPPNGEDIPNAEWAAGHALEPQVENTARVPAPDEDLTAPLTKSLEHVGKSRKAAPGAVLTRAKRVAHP